MFAVVRWSAVLVALSSAAVHVLVLGTGPTPSSLQVVAVLGMAMGCLPCAMHLALLPRRRAWAQMAVVSAVMLVGHPLLSVASGAGHHAPTGPAGGAALAVAPVVALALAVAGLVLGGPAAGGRPLSGARGRARSRVRPSARARARG
ncbi:hypothetical protein [Geodermatophilus sp. DSM 45219]|uniref:hypothetical protein n=1 Tax=Geodermatophilus sp. DSM 45219 TaxID=1881103 RepID=UPI0008821CDB|nr:hypothetical protein [Geodermatophilus sp. DSM 45219]SDO70813.1 hypothetical protein SAMN05428965_0017 [Geodermatophilus sp. DSM 45219]